MKTDYKYPGGLQLAAIDEAIARLERALDARGLAAQLDEKARAIITAAARHSTAHPPADFIDGLGRCIAAGSSLDEQLAKIAESDPRPSTPSTRRLRCSRAYPRPLQKAQQPRRRPR